MVAGPSGVGKGALIERLRQQRPEATLSVSVTTREPRAGEVDGEDYHFIAVAEFERMRDEGALLEWARVHGDYYYGTPAADVRAGIEGGTDVVFEVDYQGALNIRRALGDDAVLVFVLPPSLAELRRRLDKRHTETPDRVAARLRSAQDELAHIEAFDYLVVNDDLAEAAQTLLAIYEAERARRERAGCEALIEELTRAVGEATEGR